jgi:hypothetical protein
MLTRFAIGLDLHVETRAGNIGTPCDFMLAAMSESGPGQKQLKLLRISAYWRSAERF